MSSLIDHLLSLVRIQSSFFGAIDLGAPWGAQVSSRDSLLVHFLFSGRAWLSLEGEKGRWLEAGDLLVVPSQTPHGLADGPQTRLQEEAVWMAENTAGEPPRVLKRSLGGDGAKSKIWCAELMLQGLGKQSFMRFFARPIVLEACEGAPVPALQSVLDLLTLELKSDRPGQSLMLARLSEMLLLHALRQELSSEPQEGELTSRRALSHPGIHRALQAIYTQSQQNWGVDSLAEVAGMSRSSFAETFKRYLQLSPAKYLTRWRMEQAASLLSTEMGRTIQEVAEQVGYQNEAAFAVAFKRHFGTPPGNYRRGVLG